ncbi:MAG TPA: InlB B-repeat-containing protein [Clostridia bacterium]|nr:InlB B-repeat-containing protein [Clostridia bacterium]
MGWGNTTIPHAFSNGTVSPLGYAITFDFNDGTPPITVWVNEGEKPTPPDHTRQGYSLNRWSPAVFVAAHEDATYTAYWSVHYYSVIYAGNGNDGPSTESSSHTYNQEKALTLNEFTKTGYTFIDWNTKQDGTGISYADGQIVKNLSATQGDNFKLYAQWAINSYNLTYDANGGTGGTGPTATGYGTTLTAPTVTREGYTFMGWNPEVVATMPAADTVYKALWEEIVIATGTVTFDTGGGNAIAAITGEVGTTVTEPADPTREGYTFNGWLPAMPAVIPAENVNCVAQWTLNEYTITFDANDGVGGEVQTVEHGTRPVAPEVTREGFTFIEWTAEIVAATGDTTYTAQWTINEYTITFDANGGAGGETQAVEHGTIPDTPVVAREGYTFNGWGVEIAPATEDATYTAQWTANQYTINFDSNGGTEVEDITEDFATALSAPADPTKEGYTFNGWSPAVPVTMPAENVNCVAQWTINEYTITFDANDGVGGEVQTVEHGTRPVAPEVTREGFAFTEWTPEIVAATEDATYTATWEKIESEDEDEDVPSEETVPKEDAPADDVTDNVIDEDEVAKDVVVDEVPETGSTAAGIAVFATLSMAAAAAFVLGKRKED